ncbi:MAG: hypothetical protein KatS3mg110_3355 [Pirellulaceae bacterium]|nr:MAG: hypothetical protein KatS3mg110_3355 [Pirellulaceae bacterium]
MYQRPLAATCSLLGTLSILVTFVSVAVAQEPATSSSQSIAPLAAEVVQWMDRFQAETDQSLAEKRSAVVRQADHLQRYLASGGPRVQQGWNRFLHWEIFEQQIRQPVPDLQALNQVLQQLYSDTPGLERKPFLDFRAALHRFMNASLVARTPGMADEYRMQLKALQEALERFDQEPSAENADAIGRILGWLQDANQAGELVAKIRSQLVKPNLYAEVSARLARANAEQPVDEVLPVEDCILGTFIRGTAHTSGQVSLRLLPDQDRARMVVDFTGTATSRNTGTNRGVQIYSVGNTVIQASKQVVISADGIELEPADVQCQTATEITGVWHRSCLVRKIAWRQAQRKRPEAEQQANARAETRVAGQIDQRVEELLAEARQKFQENFRNPLVRKGEFPPVFHCVSTAESLRFTLLQANRSQLAAWSAPPAPGEAMDLSVRLHASFVGNFSEATLGGYTLTDERLVQLLEENGREVPDELRITPDKDPWSITFANRQPIRVTFGDDTVTVTVRGRQFTRGNQTVTAEMDIWATYKVERNATGVKLTRQGDVQAEYTRGGFETPARIAVKTLMRKKFEALFTPEFQGEGIELRRRSTGQDAPGEPVARLKLATLQIADGWLCLGWQLVDRAPVVASLATAP